VEVAIDLNALGIITITLWTVDLFDQLTQNTNNFIAKQCINKHCKHCINWEEKPELTYM